MLTNIFLISLSMTAVILILLIISPLLNNRFSAKWRYFVWLILALRLIIPFRLEMPDAPVNISAPKNQIIIFRQEGIPLTIVDKSFVEKGNSSTGSADYAPIITLKELLTVIWAFGAVAFFLFHIISYLIFKRRIKRYCDTVNSDIIQNVLDDMKIKRKPQFLKCSKIASPMMIGFFKPMILLPDAEYSNNEFSVILKHELTHYKRCDIWYKLLLVIANSVHWFNPLVYLMARRANRDLEYFCDDVVVKNSDINYRKEYSMAILKAMQSVEATTLSTYLNGGKKNG